MIVYLDASALAGARTVIGAILRASRLIESAKPETEIRKNLAKPGYGMETAA